MIGRSFGQHEPLTTRLHNLVRSYPKGLGIFKEFIQNADDAEANEIVFIIDEQQYNFEGLPDSMQWLHTTPALLVYNNRPFSKHDIQSIQKIGESGKSLSMGKTGRFGLGFNACYNVTDVPYFYTKNEMYFFDPHFKTVPEASSKSPGRYFNVDELISEGWPLLDAFHDFVSYGSVFKGTVFRLPFRTVQQARISEIKKDRYKVSDALDAVRELQEMGSTILLFLKHIRRLKVDHRKSDGSIVNLLSMCANNTREINQSRVEVNELLSSSDPEHILTELSIKGQVYSSCRHEYEVVVEGLEHTEAWRVVGGFFVDNDDKVISVCRNMIQNEEKALPYAGAAWPLNLNHTVPGQVFCFLPVPIQTNIPIQINGYFDLDDSRQSMFLDPSSHGSAGNRVEWNKALLENSVAQAYIRLLEELRTDIETDCVDMYYCAFPKVVDNDRSWEGWLANSFYHQASLAPLFRVSGATIWSNLSDSRSLPEELLLVGEALIADEFLPILDPPLPEHIITGFKNNQINVPMLTPQDLAFGLEQEQDVDCTMDDAPLNCLRKREYVEQILSFFLNDFPADEMEGLPLVIDCRGHLRTLGLTETPLYIAGQSWDLEVFSDHLEWFVDTKLVRNLNLIENEVTGLHYMDSKSFINELDKYISAKTVNGELKLRRGKTGTLTDTWLQAVFSRLLASNIHNLIQEIPLVPDQNHILHPVGNASTPLLFHPHLHKSDLKKALIDLSVPVVTGVSKELFALLLEFSEKEDLIWSVTPRGLVDTLVAQSKQILDEYEKVTDVHKALLNFLSREDSLISLRELSGTCEKLEELRLFPTTNGTLVNLDEPAYIAQEFKFPAGDFKVILLDDGPSHKWRELYLLLEVPELSRSRLIKEILLPEFKHFDITARAKASGWLRDNLNLAQSEEEFDSDELFEEIQSNPFIVCEDGELRAPMSIYHPESKLARTVLADEAQFPDMKTTYALKSKTWLSFFRNLEMATEPRLSDIVEYLHKLVTEDSFEHTRDRFEIVFEFLKERIETDLQGETDISDELSEALEELAELPWIPIRQNAGDLLCFKSPDVDFACPGEVYFPRVGQLIASQAYITVFKQEPNKRISATMGFASKPPLTLVINHFKEVLSTFSNQTTITNEATLVKGLGQIYRFFGEGEDTPDIDALEEDVAYKDSDNIFDLKTMFAQVPCIWDQENRRFWKPEHVFMENVWYMEPWRRTIRANEKLIESGYEALGRKEKPTVDDWKQVLQEISESGKTSEELVIREVVRRIVDELIRIDSADGEVLVPTRNDKLLPAKDVFIADAPWYESRLDSWDIPILSSSVSGIFEIQNALKIPSLAESVIERLIKDPLESDLEDEFSECCRLEDLIRSNEFINGYQRLLRHENHEVAINSLLFIQEVRVRCVKSIETCLYLQYDETERLLGDAKADFYWDQDRLQALVTEKRRRYFYDDLATILNQALGDRYLRDLSPLVHILRCEPYEIAEVLDDLKIRKVVLDPEEKPETNIEVTLQEFPDDEIHNIYENECSATEDVIDPGSDSANFNEDEEEEAAAITIDNLNHDNVSSHSHVISQSTSSIPRDYKQIADKFEDDIPKGGSENRTLPDTVGSGYKDRTTDISDIEKSQLTPATKDVSRVPTANSNKPAAVRQRLVSYVIQSETGPSSADYLSGNNDSNLKIGNAAVDIVIDHEKKSGRKARSMAHPNPGYDVISECDGETRYIEVKGTELAWGERGVALSSTQFFYAREHPDRDFWLYVVENVFSENPKIHKIHNPGGKVDYFMFDGGWRQTAENVDEKPTPSPDDEVPY